MNRIPVSVLLGLALGLSSLLFGVLTGLPALYFGLTGLRAINQSDGKLSGARLAIAGLILGGIGSVITTTGIIALLVLQVRATGARAECANHLRMIGEGLNTYALDHGRLPAATRDPQALPPEQRISWLADVLPRMGQRTKANAAFQKLAFAINREAAWDAAPNASAVAASIRVFLCPAHPDYRPRASPGLTHYVGIAGLGADAASLKRDDANAGVFGHDRGIAMKEAEGGISYTIAAAETARDNGPWLAGGEPTVRGVPAEENLVGRGLPFGGLHRGFMHALFLDGSVRPIADDMPARVLRPLATLRRPD